MEYRDLEGKIVPFGKVYKEFKADFLDGTLPSWLETATKLGTESEVIGAGATFEPLPGRGTVTVSTAAASGASCDLRSKFVVDSTQVTAIDFTLEALQYNGNVSMSVQVGIKAIDAKSGITFFQNVNQNAAAIRVYKADGTTVDFPVKMALFTMTAGDEAQNRKNLTVRLLTGKQYPDGMERQYVYLYNGDHCGAFVDITGTFTHGNLQCLARVTSSGPIKNIKTSQVKIGLWSN